MLKNLKKYLVSEKKEKTIFDIVIYGSAVKGKDSPSDIDIAVIFLEGNLRERLDKIQEIKNRLKKIRSAIDIKQILLTDLFSSDFLARQGLLLEGISVFRNKKFSEVLGFKSSTLFWYTLEGLTHTQKVRFNYVLAGRNGMEGMIKRLHGKRLVSGMIKIPIENSMEFEEVLKSNNITYKKKDVLEGI